MTTPTYIVAIEGLDAIRFLDEIPNAVKRAALRAVNRATTRGRTLADKSIRTQVAFPASYLRPSEGRLVAQPAKSVNDLEGRIVGRARPTSLARFTKDPPAAPGKRARRDKDGNLQVKVKVKPGVARYVKNAFVIKLRAGRDGPLSNLGVAVRSESPPKGAYKPTKLGKNLWLLYGPAVNQVLYSVRNNGGVAETIAPEIAQILEAEFLRQLDL